MIVRQPKIVALLCLIALIACEGCEPGQPKAPPVSKVEASITGKVTVGGTAVTKGKVTVSPPGPPFVENIAEIKPDGTYQVKTYIGKNSISVVGTGNPAAGNGYNKADFDVNAGSNTIDLELPLKQR